jgi:hypothetical protein
LTIRHSTTLTPLSRLLVGVGAVIVVLASCSQKVLTVVDSPAPPIHRYSFNGVGTTVLDSIGNAHGAVVGAALTGRGSLTLAGGIGAQAPYVVLPHGLLRQLHDATIEAWVNWAGPVTSDGIPAHWQRIFDFGEGSTGVEGEQATGGIDALSYLFLTPQTDPRSAGEVPGTRVAFQVPHDQQSVTFETVVDTAVLPIGSDTHVAVVVDGTGRQMALFVNGAIVGSVNLMQADPLSYVYDINDWLGRSQFAQDDGFNGTYTEFRIYDEALTPAQVRSSYAGGPDADL